MKKVYSFMLIATLVALGNTGSVHAASDATIVQPEPNSQIEEGSKAQLSYSVTLTIDAPSQDVNYSYRVDTDGQCQSYPESANLGGPAPTPTTKLSKSATLSAGSKKLVSFLVVAFNDSDVEGPHSCDFTYSAASSDSSYPFTVSQ
jgi:hypothetical protein